ncbi:lipocalin family protein [Persicitalea sp.]|uniref:lipocalin family protein n=1 Tax=Persicitalea sp. TaxID=3100273 RepID=UPI0035938E83
MVFVLASLTACKKDSDPTPSGVEGNWQITAINIVPAFSGISDYLAIYTLAGDTCPSKIAYNFKSNNSLEITAPATCTATKNELNDLIGVDNTTTWKVENNKLILTTSTFAQTVDLTVNATIMNLGVSDLLLSDNLKHTITFAFKRI